MKNQSRGYGVATQIWHIFNFLFMGIGAVCRLIFWSIVCLMAFSATASVLMMLVGGCASISKKQNQQFFDVFVVPPKKGSNDQQKLKKKLHGLKITMVYLLGSELKKPYKIIPVFSLDGSYSAPLFSDEDRVTVRLRGQQITCQSQDLKSVKNSVYSTVCRELNTRSYEPPNHLTLGVSRGVQTYRVRCLLNRSEHEAYEPTIKEKKFGTQKIKFLALAPYEECQPFNLSQRSRL